MFKARKVYWMAQFGGWSLLALLILLSSLTSRKAELSLELVVSTGIFFSLGIILTHAMRAIYIHFGWLNLRLGPLLPRIILTAVFFAGIMSFATNGYRVSMSELSLSFPWIEYFLDVLSSSVFFVLWNSVYFTFHFFQRSREQEMNNLQLSADNNEIELKNLRSQLNPHFLFNSLNSIRALIEIDPNQAKDNITKLANLLRKSLVIGKEQLVPLREEIEIVKTYLDLEKVRFEERIDVIIEIERSLLGILIPPFMLQTLVENAIKHGISKRIEGGTIWIRASKLLNKVVLSVENHGQMGKTVDTGIGIENTIRRLEIQYKGKAQFSLIEKEETVVATIELID